MVIRESSCVETPLFNDKQKTNDMKKITLFLMSLTLVGLTACAQKNTQDMKTTKTLVAYFSATGTTHKVAQQIAQATGGKLYPIRPEQPYTDADLDWTDKSSRSTLEMQDPASRPAIVMELHEKDMKDYDTLFIGFPIWWNVAPHAVNTFIESYDLSGKVLIPFATSGSSSISNSVKELKKAYPDYNWQEGKLLNGDPKAEVEKWLK